MINKIKKNQNYDTWCNWFYWKTLPYTFQKLKIKATYNKKVPFKNNNINGLSVT